MRTALLALLLTLHCCGDVGRCGEAVYPGPTWTARDAQEVGLQKVALEKFAQFVGGRGCVVRNGYLVHAWGNVAQRADVASAVKPVFVHLLFAAQESGKIAGVDELVSRYEPRLLSLNAQRDFKDRAITWKHLANQTSCYGVVEKPGTAFCYNDWQMALFADTLFLRVYQTSWSKIDAEVLRPALTEPLQCEDNPTLLAFGVGDRAGRLAISARDFARFGLLYLRRGSWRGRQLLRPEHVSLATTSPLPNRIPRAGHTAAEMFPGQRSLGSTRVPDNQTDHLGSYSWAWWTNGIDRDGRRHWPGAPDDAFAALGHGGRRGILVIPSLELIASWNDSLLDGRALQTQAFQILADADATVKTN
jgi:CubicO group peptidase (beta-lactamase class C family)